MTTSVVAAQLASLQVRAPARALLLAARLPRNNPKCTSP